MNKRSFRRGLKDPELREGWTRVIEQVEGFEAPTIEAALQCCFEKVLKKTIDEINRQAAEEISGLPIQAWGIITGKTGQSFRITIDCEPPSIDPNLN